MRILILHDRFQFRGGAERLVLDLAKSLGADILTEFWTHETYPREEVPHSLFVLDEGNPHAIVFRYVRAHWNFWWKTRKIIKNYDVLIFSGNNCLSASLRPLYGKKTIFYCHSPVRYVYDLLAHRRAEEPSRLKRVIYYDIGKWGIRTLYRLGLFRMQTVATNSRNVQERLAKFCHTFSRVVYPPIHTSRFQWIDQGEYFLSFARLDELKRVDVIVKAFQQMPDRKLVVVSGGADEGKIRELAKDFPNISIRGWVDEATLVDLIGRSLATIYIPIEEDFGMTAVESMSAGKPCIGVNEGGLKETILDGETGILIPTTCTPEDVATAVRALSPERALAMRFACESRAKLFAKEVFEQNMRTLVTGKRIAIDASRSQDATQKTGVEVASDGVIRALMESVPGTANITYYTPSHISWLPRDDQRIIHLRRFWTVLGLSYALWKAKPDALLVPVHAMPLWCPARTVRIIHDVSFLRKPEAYSLFERCYMRFDLWRARRICSNVFVPTNAVKQDLISLAQFPEEKIIVNGFGIDDAPAIAQVPKEHIILAIGRLETKKNTKRLIEAFNLFHETHPDWKFILIGKEGFGFEHVRPLLASPNITHLGYVSNEEKWAWLSRASIFAHVSHEEGFAFPMLEAFVAGTPVVASAIPTLLEVGEDACEFVSPEHTEEIARAFKHVADHSEIQKSLIEKGRERATYYTWSRVAERIWKALL